MRKILWASVVCLGLSLSAFADTSTKEPGGGKQPTGKAKPGAACKVDSDCDQSGRPLRCRESKCEALPVHPVT
jgi:hypothetical protein